MPNDDGNGGVSRDRSARSDRSHTNKGLEPVLVKSTGRIRVDCYTRAHAPDVWALRGWKPSGQRTTMTARVPLTVTTTSRPTVAVQLKRLLRLRDFLPSASPEWRTSVVSSKMLCGA